MSIMPIVLNYGVSGRFSCSLPPERVIGGRLAPTPLACAADAIRAALEHPLDFPPLARAVVPGDRVVLALDRHTPEAPGILAEVWRIFERQGVEADHVLILQPPDWSGGPLADPRRDLPDNVRAEIEWRIHDLTEPTHQAYLATSAVGERIYLARELVEADFVVSIGQVKYDPLLGYRGTNSVFYPGLSSSHAVARAHGQGHRELEPDDERTLRNMIDEVAWLLGAQFSIQVIAAGGTGAVEVLAGFDQSVYHRGKELLAEHWLVRLKNRPQIIVAAVESDAAGHSWTQIGAAMATARNLVANGGKVVILSELRAEVENGMAFVRDAQHPRDALKRLRQQAPPDLIPATQLAQLADWASVYLLSKMDGDVVEELFMTPLENEREVQRLLASDEPCLFLGAAQNTYGQIE